MAKRIIVQLAASLEGLTLSSQTDESLRRRVDQLTAMTRISREINTTTEGKYLLQVVYDEALRTTRADCGTILLFNLENTNGSDKAPEIIFHLGPNYWVYVRLKNWSDVCH